MHPSNRRSRAGEVFYFSQEGDRYNRWSKTQIVYDRCIIYMPLVRSLPEEAWRRNVEEHPASNVFHTPEMFHVFHRTKDHQPELWAFIKDGHISALFLPVQVTLMDGLLRRFTTRSVAYGSVLCASGSEGQEALARLLQTYTNKSDGASLFTELRNLSNMEAVQPVLRRRGFVYQDHLNYLIDLKRLPEEILNSIGRRTRKHIRRGLRRENVVVEQVTEREHIATCYNLIQESYRAAHVPLADRSLFEAAFNILHPINMVRFTLAFVDRVPVATSIELLYKETVYGWYSGVDRSYSSYVPSEMIMWEILKWGAENGYRVYDFGGAGIPDEKYSVRDFKAKFGGELVSYGRNTYIHSPTFFTIAERGYQLLRRFL